MTARIAIDLNVRIGADLTYSGFEDITGAAAEDLPRGTPVEVHEAESGACGPAVVAGRDFARKLIYVKVEWRQMRPASMLEPVTFSGDGEDVARRVAMRPVDEAEDVR